MTEQKGANRGDTTIEPADCFARVGWVRAMTELLRLEMGRPADTQPDLGVTGAEPREVYGVALGMFRKADRLSFEHTGEQGVLPVAPSLADLRPADVLAVADATATRLERVAAAFGIKERPAAPARDTSKTPSDVLRSTFAANRQLNLLLDQQTAPADVFQQFALAIGYAGQLLAHATGSRSMPELPAFEHRKRPADCYRRLGGLVDRVEVIFAKSQLKMLDLTVGAISEERVTPSDVYDLASLLVSELAFLHAQIPGLMPPHGHAIAHHGRRLPAHVYQAAGLLDAQLAALQAHVEKNPNALRAR